MKEVLEFIFSSWYHYAGIAVLLMILSKWRLVTVVQKQDDGVIEKLAAFGAAAQARDKAVDS